VQLEKYRGAWHSYLLSVVVVVVGAWAWATFCLSGIYCDPQDFGVRNRGLIGGL
jgi:hypothetical protein